jgi:large subunit ribosomal protein L20
MSRAKKGFKARRRRNRVFKQAKGFFGSRSRLFKVTKMAVLHAWKDAYVGRKLRKRDMRGLWITRINAGARLHGMSYSKLIGGLKLANVALDRKILADLAVADPEGFAKVAAVARGAK